VLLTDIENTMKMSMGISLMEFKMKRVKLDGQDESVKRFVLALTVEHGGAVLELNGKEVACVVPPPKAVKRGGASGDWTLAKNNRRCDLIDREIDGAISPEETVELRRLQDEMLRYQNKVAPWPIEAARHLHQKLLKKAAKARNGPVA
jgi:hypothetical protein